MTTEPIVVIGGGVAGCTLLYELSKRFAGVVLLEAGEVGRQGASSTPLALLNAYRGKSAKAKDFDLDGLAATWKLAEELKGEGLEPGLYPSGVYRFAATAKQGRNWRNRFERGDVAHGSGDRVWWLEPDTLPDGYQAPFGGFLAEAGGWVRPHTLLTSLVSAAKSRGATVVEGCRVDTVTANDVSNDSDTSRYRLITSQGERYAETVILCPGATPNPDLPLPDLERVAGEVVGFGLGDDTSLPHPIAGSVYGGQRDGELFVGGNHRAPNEDDPDAPTWLRRSMSRFIPPLAGAPQTSLWSGVRAVGEDNLPQLRELSPGLWFMGALAGRGFLASASLARSLAETLVARQL